MARTIDEMGYYHGYLLTRTLGKISVDIDRQKNGIWRVTGMSFYTARAELSPERIVGIKRMRFASYELAKFHIKAL